MTIIKETYKLVNGEWEDTGKHAVVKGLKDLTECRKLILKWAESMQKKGYKKTWYCTHDLGTCFVEDFVYDENYRVMMYTYWK